MADKLFKLFGFEIRRGGKTESEVSQLPSPVPPTDEDGTGMVTASSHHFGYYIDQEGASETRDNVMLIRKYRGMAQHPEVDMAIEEVVNESIVMGDNELPVSLNQDEVDLTASIKKAIDAEFQDICAMLNLQTLAHDLFRSWYVDGRLAHHLVVDPKKLDEGIQEIRYIDPIKLRKVREVKYKKDEETGLKVVAKVKEFYLFNEKMGKGINHKVDAMKLTADSISFVTSGLLDENRKRVVSHLHKAIKPTNQLRMMEDSLVIYRLARAPERRLFYVDTGNLPRNKADAYVKDIMSRYRNKLVYDANTGELKDDRKHMSMLEDYWLPRREGGRGTEVSTLPGGENLGQIEDIIFFQKKLYRSLNVPVSRLEQESQFSLGRSSEITRDEVKFQKFIDRLRTRFSKLFLDILKKQLVMKNIITDEDWENIKTDLFVDFKRDNHFTELKESEVLRERLQTMDMAMQYVGEFVTKDWCWKNIWKFSEDEIKELKKLIDKEEDEGEYDKLPAFQQQEEPPPPPESPPPSPTADKVDEPASDDEKEDKKREKQAAKESFNHLEKLREEETLANIELIETLKDYLKEDE